MTQEPPPSWPPTGPGGWEQMSVDPISGEPIPPAQPDHSGGEQPPTAAYPDPGFPVQPYPAQPYPGQEYPGQPYPPQAYAGQPYPVQPYPGYPPPPYPGHPPYPYPYAWSRPTNPLAIAALILGVLWIYWIGSIMALIFGYVARSQIRRTGQGGDGMATAGIVLGWAAVGFLALALVVLRISYP